MNESSLHKPYKETNPTTFSPVEETLDLKLSERTHKEKYKLDGVTTPVDIPVWVDKDGNEYFQKMPELKPGKQDLPVEHFVAMLIKGVLNSSDLIKHGDIYLSKKMDLSKVENGSPEDLKAEIFLLNYLFEDMDKATKLKEGSLDQAQNIRIHPETNAFTHYDYSEGFRSKEDDPTFWYKNGEKPEDLAPIINYQLNNIYKYEIAPKGRPKLPDNNLPSREIEKAMRNKAILLKEQINDLEFFKAVVRKSEIDLNSQRFHFLTGEPEEERIQELQQLILNRIDVLIKVLNSRK